MSTSKKLAFAGLCLLLLIVGGVVLRVSRQGVVFGAHQTQAQAQGNNGVVNGGVPFSAETGFSTSNNAAAFGNAASFSASTQYITLPAAAGSFAAGASFTVSARVRTTTTGTQVFYSQYQATNPLWLGISSGSFLASVGGYSGFVNSNTAINDGNWHTVAFSMATGTTARVFVDGVLKATATGTFNGTAGGNLYIGALLTGSSPWPGQVDEVAIFNSTLYTATYTPPTAPFLGTEIGLVSLYHLESDGTDSKASSAVGINAISPTAIIAPGTTTITLTGTNTHWTTSTPTASVTNTTTTVTAGTVTVVDDTHVTLPVTVNSVAGSFTLTLTNGTDGALTSPSVTTTTNIYFRTDATDPIYGQNILVLVPNGLATTPYNSANPTKLLLYFHGAGEDQTALLSDSLKSSCVTALLNAGYILAGSNAHGAQNWGNQASVDDYAGLWKYCTNNYNISKTAFWGQSMGGLDSLLSLSEQKIKDVVGWLGTYPVCNLANLYSLGTYTGAINTAFGITGGTPSTYANLTTGHDPALKWGWAFRRVPMRLYSSTGDTVVPKASNADVLATLVGTSATVTVIPTTGNHGDASNFVPSEYVTFFNSCFASPPATSGSTTVSGTKRKVQ